MSFVTIRSEGGLLPPDVIQQVLRCELGGQKPEDFGLPAGRRLVDEIAAVWQAANEYWEALQARLVRLRPGQSTTSATRDMWLIPLLEALGYELTYQAAAVEVGGVSFVISHRAGTGETAPPVHLEGVGVDLDRRPEEGPRRRSPQALMQDYLNRSDHLWGIIANGRRLRLLRQSPRLTRPTYLEFDLEAMMAGGKFDEFIAFYRLCHRSRLPKNNDEATECWLERYHQAALAQGGRVRDRLRDGVERALVVLGNGFLRHPQNQALRGALTSGKLTAAGYYQELLRLIYRILFLMVAEERRLLVPDGPGAQRAQRIYDRVYSIGRLRTLCERPIDEASRHGDLWLGLQQAFRIFGSEEEVLPGIPPLNGDLFGPAAIPHLEGTRLYNADLLKALRHLSLFQDGQVQRRVNYAALDVEELGSVYESLLDFTPAVDQDADGFRFGLAAGTDRKSTGSYYTRPELVKELVESALVPVLERRLQAAGPDRAAREQAILSLTVCDPACGSGHFLLEAARRLGRELAKVRSQEEEPAPREFRAAVRDVIQHCIYGVDVNPLAVDLCKVALWIEGHNSGLPLTFLDHRIRCGNSLVGVFDLDVITQGIPDAAYNPVTGDDKELAKALKRRNRQERKELGQARLVLEAPAGQAAASADAWHELAAMPERTATEVREKATRYAAVREPGTPWWQAWMAANLWTAAFFATMNEENLPKIPTSYDAFACLMGGVPAPAKALYAQALAHRHRFFHWPLEFPEVFARGGFDVVLGNPPWERTKLQDEEFFATRDPAIAGAANQAQRRALIPALEMRNPALLQEYRAAKHAAEAEAKFAQDSGRFPLCGHGDINTYALFAELARSLIRPEGRFGMVLPTGVATDYTYRGFFARLVEERGLVSLYDFENREGLFPGVHRQYKFSLLTVGGEAVQAARFAFFLTRTEHLGDERRVFTLATGDLRLFNPNTGTCPVFRTRADAELTAKIYRTVPVLVNERTGDNPWGIVYLRMFDMSNDSSLFNTEPEPDGVPLYEAKLFHQFDHRWATYANGYVREVPLEAKADPYYHVIPQYWVKRTLVETRVPLSWPFHWLLAVRDIARATDERTVIATVIPRAATGHTAPLLFSNQLPQLKMGLLANLNSLCLDYIARQKVGGTHLTYFILKQLPVLSPHTYTAIDLDFIVPRVLELTYTSHSLAPFARDLGYDGPPFPWDEHRRQILRAELDAYYAHLYGLTRDELRYILDPADVYGDDYPGETFRVLKENEMRKYGEFRTRRLVLEAYDDLAPYFRRRAGR